MHRFVIFLFFLTLSTATKPTCDHNSDYFNDRCFSYSLQKNDFEDSLCKTSNMDFAAILNQFDQNYFLFASGNAVPFWLGLQLVDGNWVWKIKGENVQVVFTNWENKIVPNDPEKACILFDSPMNGIWRATNCSEIYPSVCQYDPYPCPQEDELVNDKCYSYSFCNDTYENANRYCQQSEYDLVSILSQEEQDFILRTSSLTVTWLGIRLIDGKWQWSINGEIVEASFTNWEDNVVPNDPKKACAVLDGWANGVWRAVDCNQQYLSICKTDAYHPPNGR